MPNNNHKHLRDILNSKFIIPIALGVYISLISTCACLIILMSNSMKQKRNREIVAPFKTVENQPLLFGSEGIIIENYQLVINSLVKIEEYINFLYKNTKIKDLTDTVHLKKKMKDFIQKYSFNAFEMRSAKKVEVEGIIKDKKNYDYGIWHVNDKIASIQELAAKFQILKTLYLLTNMNGLFNSIYETLNLKEQRIIRIYVAVPELNLLYKYPLFFDKADEIDFSGSWCLKDQFLYPYYFYFQCRPWFIESMRMFNEHKIAISITEPYFINDNTFGITICLRANDVTGINASSYFLYCIDTSDFLINKKLNSISDLLTGYMFLLRIESKLPIFYPKNHLDYLMEYDIYEFPLNSSYSLEEVLLYNSITYNDFTGYNDGVVRKAEYKYGSYIKNNELWNYTVIPIYYYYEGSGLKENKIHLLNLIYTENYKSFANKIEDFLSYIFLDIFSPILIFSMQGVVLVLISKYLTNAIASSIVLPMKNIKKTLEKLNKKHYIVDKKKQTKGKKEDDNEEDLEELIEDEEEEEEEDDEEDEEYINVRSKDIQDLFVRIIELKDSLATINLRNEAVTTRCLPNYLFATEVFKERKKANAYLTCNANVGNLLLNCKKYDIAIMHLIESEHFEIKEEKPKKELNKTKAKNSNVNGNSINELIAIQKEDKIIQEKDKYLLESRYPKLIYCFKQYFSNIKRLYKEEKKLNYRNKKLDEDDEIQSKMELFSSKSMHHIPEYESTLKDYQELSKKNNQVLRLIYSNIEYIEFYIKYEIKNKRNVSILSTLKNLIEDTETIIKEKKLTSKPKRIYKALINNTTSVDTIEISKDMLFQRIYYLRGYLAFCCKNYNSAIDYLFKVVESKNSISDAKIVVQSFKKLIKIAKIYRKEYSTTNYVPEGSLLDRFIFNKEKEIKKFCSEDKDFLIIINTYTNKNAFFIKAAFDKARLIFESYVNSKDRFGLMLYGNYEINLITKLDFIRESDQCEYFLQFMHKYARDDVFSRTSQTNQEEDLKTVILKAKTYIRKKKLFGPNRHLFIIIFTHNLSENSHNFFFNEKGNEIIKHAEERLIVVVQNNTIGLNEIEYNPQLFPKKNSFDIFKIDNIIPNLKSIIRMYGNIQDLSLFSMEKYSSSNGMN